MKKIIILCMTLFIGITFSQTTYNSSDFGSAGYSFLESKSSSNLNLFDFSLTGTNHTWNYATIGVDQSYEKKVLDPDNTKYMDAFLTECILNTGNPATCTTTWNTLTDIARLEFDSIETGALTVYDITSMMTYSSGYLVANIQGAEIKDTNNNKVPVTAEFTDKDTVFVFPMNFNDNHTSHGKWGVDLTPLGYNLQLVVDYTRNYTVEGWGSLITPYKLHSSVLKVRTQIDEVDSLYFNGTSFGVPRTIVQYTWFDPNYGMPVMQASGQISGVTETIEQVTFMDSTYVGINEDNLLQLSVYPNPVIDELTVSFNDQLVYTHAVILDASGKELKRFNKVANMNISDLSKGSYFVGVFNDSRPIGFKQFSKQ